MPRVIHFEFVGQQPEQSAAFYSGVFGWSVNKWDGPQEYWLLATGTDQPGIDGGIARSCDPNSPAQTVVTIGVPSVDEYAGRVTEHGGTIVVPKMAIPGVGYLVYAKDVEGNIFGMMQTDATAQ